jgi:iron(II)-dependent oxidoreductase
MTAEVTQGVPDGWRFAPDPADRGLQEGWAAPEFDDTSWAVLKTWQSWSVQGYYDYSGIAWYRLRIDIPAELRGQFLVFQGINDECEVFLDGRSVARRFANADEQKHGVQFRVPPFRVRLPERSSTTVAVRVQGADTHQPDSRGPGLVKGVFLTNAPLIEHTGYWLAPDEHVDRAAWIEALRTRRARRREELALDGRVYSGPFEWSARTWVEGLVFLHDERFYDPARGYLLDEFLDDGIRRFGGYDALLLWHMYPNIGVDDQDQFEMFGNLPGGFPALRDLVQRAHARGVKVMLPYAKWEKPRPDETHEQAVARVLKETGADGVFLDTVGNESLSAMREEVDRDLSGIVFEPECQTSDVAVKLNSASWGQYYPDGGYSDHAPGLPIAKWIEPRHMIHYDSRRWRHHRTVMFQHAFLNGCGVVIWDNIFGSWNRYTPRDEAMLRRMLPIQRFFWRHFASESWEPFLPTLAPDIDAASWEEDHVTVFALANWATEPFSGPVLEVTHRAGARYFDLWQGLELTPAVQGSIATIALDLDARGISAIAIVHDGAPGGDLTALLEKQRREAATPLESYSNRWVAPDPPKLKWHSRSPAVPADQELSGMRFLPDVANFRLEIIHNLGEGSCYPDHEVEAWDSRRAFMFQEGELGRNVMHCSVLPMLRGFFIDRNLVTKGDYQRFLHASGYRPADTTNFLKDWDWRDSRNPEPPRGLEDHPVVWVDLQDARAFAAWCSKRLPTEAEWQYAAGGPQRLRYPWGDSWQANAANDNSGGTTPVGAYPAGTTPTGINDMCGNVWHWTESERTDGNRYVLLRGGSFYRSTGSSWFFDRYNDFGLSRGEISARPTNYHAKLFLLGPSADRKATIGFRCVKDCEPAT